MNGKGGTRESASFSFVHICADEFLPEYSFPLWLAGDKIHIPQGCNQLEGHNSHTDKKIEEEKFIYDKKSRKKIWRIQKNALILHP